MAEKEPWPSSGLEDDSSKDTSSSPTPDLWMLVWLKRHRQSLLDGLQNSVQFIADYLVEQGHMHDLRSDVYQQIRLDTTTPLEKVRKLLDWLATQPSTVFWSFQRALGHDCLRQEAVHRLAVTDKEVRELTEYVQGMCMPDKLALMSCRSVLKAREELQKSYKARDELLMSAGLAKGKTMAIDKIMVNVCLLSSEEVKKAFEKPSFSSHHDQERSQYIFSKILQSPSSSVSLEEVFKAKPGCKKGPHKVVAAGGAGCGKSVCFTRKAPYEWAFGRLWKQFALLFCLELRDKSVWQAKTLTDLLKLSALGLSPEEQEEVRQFVTNHPDKVVIVCDGLDEGTVDESSLLWSLLQANSIGIPSSLRVVVTTRPCIAAGDLSQSTSYQGVEVVGFTKKDIGLFARKYLGEEASKKLLSLLDKQPSIASMMHAPLFCLLVCDLSNDDEELPSRRTEIFQKIVVALLRRYAKVQGLKVPFQDLTNAPASLKELVIGLGKVAFQGLQKKQLYFTDVELIKAGMPLEALELGLLVKSESTNFCKRDEYTFSHLALQEFLAALYVSSEVVHTDADMAKLVKTVHLTDDHLAMFWMFLAGLLDGSLVEVLLDRVLSSMTTLNKSHQKLQLCRCYSESVFGRSGTPSASVGKLLKECQEDFSLGWNSLSVSDCAAIGTVLQSHPQTERLHTVDFWPCRMTNACFAQLLPGLQQCKFIKTLYLDGHSLSQSSAAAMSDVIANNASTLEEVYLDCNKLGDNGLEKLSESLKLCRKLRVLSLSSNGLTSRSGATLSDVLCKLPTLERLDVNGNQLGDSGMEQLAHGLQFCTCLQRLDISKTALTSQSIPVLRHLRALLAPLRLVVERTDFSAGEL